MDFFFLIGGLENSSGNFELNDDVGLYFEPFRSTTQIPESHYKYWDAAGRQISAREPMNWHLRQLLPASLPF